MTAPELAIALEERGFESVGVPEHSHIPLSGKTRSQAVARDAGRDPASIEVASCQFADDR
jgi:hypothetical protein